MSERRDATDMGFELVGTADPITGVHDFRGQRLHFLQIGLGTFGTVIQNLTKPEEVYAGVEWLLEAASDDSPLLRSVGVEPVPEHAARLRPYLQKLPHSALVQAAVVRHGGQQVAVHALDADCYQSYLRQVKATDRNAFVDAALYLRNMSCVGQDHPEFVEKALCLEREFGVKVEAQTIDATAFTYSALTERLGFCGVEVLMIDAEGHDCQILLSMLDHCTPGNEHHLPDIIQFETMGHNDKIDGEGTESWVIHCLETIGYAVAAWGHDTQLVKLAALTEERIKRWLDTLCCDHCGTRGEHGMPFRCDPAIEATALCYSCSDVRRWLGPLAFDWNVIGDGPILCSGATDGDSLWAVCSHGTAHRRRSGTWESVADDLEQIAVDGNVLWAIDNSGCLRRYDVVAATQCASFRHCGPGSGTRLKHLSVTAGAVWCTDASLHIHVYLPAEARWREILGKRLGQVSVSSDGLHVWGVHPMTEEVFYRPGLEGCWESMRGKLCQISVSGDGCHIWGVNSCHDVYYRAGLEGKWIKIPGLLSEVCTSSDGWTVWGID